MRYPLLETIRMMMQAALDILFPATDRARRIEAQGSLSAAPHTVERQCTITFLAPYEGRVKECLCALKFERNMRAASLLADMLDDFLIEHLAERALFGSQTPLAVPVPLGPDRRRDRGFNQVEAVLERTRALLGGGITVAPALIRTRDTAMQSTLPRAERLANMRGAFSAAPAWREKLRGEHVLLIDDIATTGATLAEARSVLRSAGATVECITLAG